MGFLNMLFGRRKSRAEIPASSKQSQHEPIAEEILTYINNNGGISPAWYIGIASDPITRLFNDHNVQKDGDAYIYRFCGTEEYARDILQYFLNLQKRVRKRVRVRVRP